MFAENVEDGHVMTSARRSLPPAWAVAAGLAVLFALAGFFFPEPPHSVEYKRIENGMKMPLWVVVYKPQPAKFEKAPAAVVCQPINDPPEYGRMLELELVHDGFVVVTFDWRGQASDENRQLLHTHTQAGCAVSALAEGRGRCLPALAAGS